MQLHSVLSFKERLALPYLPYTYSIWLAHLESIPQHLLIILTQKIERCHNVYDVEGGPGNKKKKFFGASTEKQDFLTPHVGQHP